MILEPNFIFGIKQTSLHSKEDSHPHPTIWSHTCLSARSRLQGISQPSWFTAVLRSLSTSKPWLTFSVLCTLSLRLMKLTPQTYSMASHDQNPGSWSPPKASCTATLHKRFQHNPTHRRMLSTPRSDFGHMRRHDSLVATRSVKLWNSATCCHMRIVRSTCYLGMHVPPRSERLLLMSMWYH